MWFGIVVVGIVRKVDRLRAHNEMRSLQPKNEQVNIHGVNRHVKFLHSAVKPAAGLRAHLTEEEGVRSEACHDTRSDS
jgi:hypothetical protein